MLERDIVIEVITGHFHRRSRRLLGVILLVMTCRTTALIIITAAGATPAVEHLHLVGDDFGGITVLTRILVLPLARPQTTARRLKKTTLCHSVRSCLSPVCLSFQLSDVAIVILVTADPLGI